MYLLYADESGDAGPQGMGDHFILSGLVVHESRWPECFRIIKDLRIVLRDEYGIKRNAELHANRNIAGRGALWGKRWTAEERVRLFQLILEAVTQMPGVRTINVCIHKKNTVFDGKRGRPVEGMDAYAPAFPQLHRPQSGKGWSRIRDGHPRPRARCGDSKTNEKTEGL
jgi:hypothetical protein